MQALVDGLLQFKSCLHGLERSTPFRAAWLGDVLEDDSSSSFCLIFHQLHSMLTFLIRTFLEELSKAMKSLVITVEISCHGEIDIAGIELHVDLFIDQGFTLLMIVLADLRTHLDVEDLAVIVDVIEVYVKS